MRYDINIKDIFERAGSLLIQTLLKKKIKKIQKLPQEIQIVKQIRPDFLAIIESGEGRFIVQIEFQAQNDMTIPERMFLTFSLLSINYRLPVEQFVLWIGKGKCKIPSYFESSSFYTKVHHTYRIIDMRQISPEIFLKSDKPEIILLSILCRADDKNTLAKKIITKLLKLRIPERDLLNYFLNLEVLGELRGLKIDFKEVIRGMGMDLKVDIRKLWSYQEGKKEGKREGRWEGFEEGIKKGLQEGIKKGRQEGIEKGLQEGIKKGRQEGLRRGLYEAIVLALELKFGKKVPHLNKKIKNIQDVSELKRLKKEVLKAKTLEEFIEAIDGKL